MCLFQNHFIKSKGKPIIYNGKKLILKDILELPNTKHELLIVFLEAERDWKQGISITTEGNFIYQNNTFKNNLILWERDSPETVNIQTVTQNKKLEICNIWDTGDGVIRKGESQYNHHKAIRNAFNRAHRSAAPDWFKSYLLRELSVKEKKQAIQLLLQTHNAEFGGVHIVLIDGVGDLVQSVNDEQECNELVLFLEQLAIRYNCPVVTILHLNPGSSVKSRGHLGSQMERKCESMLTILKDPDTEISVLEGKLLRNAGGWGRNRKACPALTL